MGAGCRSLPDLLKFAAGGLAEGNCAIRINFSCLDGASGTLGAGGNELIAGQFGYELDYVPSVGETEVGFGTVVVFGDVEGFGHGLGLLGYCLARLTQWVHGANHFFDENRENFPIGCSVSAEVSSGDRKPFSATP